MASSDAGGAASAAGARNSAAARSNSERRRMGGSGGLMGDMASGEEDAPESSAACRGSASVSAGRPRCSPAPTPLPSPAAMVTRPYETLTEAEWTQVDRIHEMLD